MPSGVHKNHKGPKPTNPALPKKTRVELTPDQAKRMTKLLTDCVEAGLLFAQKVLTNKEQVEVIRFTRDGVKEKLKVEKYSPELKVKLFEILIGKVFAEKKEVGVEDQDGDAIKVVGFKFTTAPNNDEKKQEG